MIRYSIYTLSCPIDNTVRYIGATRVALKTRLSIHISSLDGSKRKNEWISDLKNQNLKPIIEEIDFIFIKKEQRVLPLEKYWIAQFKQWGFELYNSKDYLQNPRKGLSYKVYNKLKKQNKLQIKTR